MKAAFKNNLGGIFMREKKALRKMLANDPSGLEILMNVYTPYVSTIVWDILRGFMSPEDCEEVVSDVFIAAWNQAADLKLGRIKSWLAAVARNQAKNKLRELEKTQPLEDDAMEICISNEPEDYLERSEERNLIKQAIWTLSKQDQEIFLRHYYYFQTTKEISLSMKMNESTVKTKLRRGRIKLKEILVKEGFADET